MRKHVMMSLLLGMVLCGATRAAVPVDGVTGATQVAPYGDKQRADDRRVNKGMQKMRKSLPRVNGALVETAVTMTGRTMAQSAKWKGALPSPDKMKVEKAMNFKATAEGHNDLHTYQYLTLPGSQVCAVRIEPLGACVYFSAPADVAQNMASAVHTYVAPALEATLCGKSVKVAK